MNREWDPAWGVWVYTDNQGRLIKTEADQNMEPDDWDNTETYDDGY